MHSSGIPTSMAFLFGGGCAIVLSYLLWRLVARVAPLGVVQILVAIAIGPGVLGAFWPHAVRQIFSTSFNIFDAPGWLAVALFTFVSGGQSRLFEERRNPVRVIGVAVVALVLPFAAGTALGFWFYENLPVLVGRAGQAWIFAVGIGICIATTALPVLALILGDLGLLDTRTGREAIVMAVVSDVAVWCMLGFIVSSSQGRSAHALFDWTSAALLLAPVPIAAAAVVLSRRLRGLTVMTDASALTLSIAAIVLAGVLAEAAGMHFAIGSFFAGLLVPRAIFVHAERVFEPFCLYIALPFFFLSVSAKLAPITQFNFFWLCLATTMAVAVVTKFAAACGSSLLFGADLRKSCLIGALAQCKGMMEVVGLKILYDAGIISAECLAPLLAMAILTTLCCKPFALLFLRDRRRPSSAASALAAE